MIKHKKRPIVLTLFCGVVRMWGDCLVYCGGVFLGGHALELGSGVQISKLALGLVLELRVLRGPILKFARPTPFVVRDPVCSSIGWPSRPT